MKIDREKIENNNMTECYRVCQMFLSGELVEPMSRDEVENIIGSFDGNRIIYTDYDSEPSITEDGIKQIASAIVGKVGKPKEEFCEWKLSSGRTHYETNCHKNYYCGIDKGNFCLFCGKKIKVKEGECLK